MLVTRGDLDPERLAGTLTTRRLGRPYLFLASCGSTNDEVAARAAAGAPEGLLLAADQQTRGRGRRGRAWHSPAGENLCFSLLLRPALAAEQVAPLALAAGSALARALEGLGLGFRPLLKWPNDVLLDGVEGPRKVAGILAEMASQRGQVRHLVLGVGINVNSREFAADLAGQATSLALVGGKSLDRLSVLTSFLAAFEPLYQEFVAHGPGAALELWRRFARFGQPCRIELDGDDCDGIAEGVDETGALLVRTGGGTLLPIHAGDVSWSMSRAVL
ncbi:MAG: biotin--[acetyl-CoA-carboxylase] ligase [Polyangia bacterium]|jgi:BirA family biotin operon repressor/biotin-[acetyl-CoA-carboxylase] ligase